MNFLAGTFGGIVDLVEGRYWPPNELDAEVMRRSRILFSNGVSERSDVAILHGGTAHFVADLLAAWTCGATAACLDPALTSGELDNLISFVQPTTILTRGAQTTISIQNTCTIDLADTSLTSQLSSESDMDDPALWHTDLAPVAAECNGIIIGNGPGDPKDLTPLAGC